MSDEIPHYNEIRCSFTLPYCIRVPDGQYSFPYKDKNIVMTLERHGRLSEKEQLQVGALDGEPDVAEKDRFGRYDFSSVNLTLTAFRFEYCPTFGLKEIKALAVQCVNRFMQFMNRAHDSYWAIYLTPDDIFSFQLGCYMDGVNVPGAVLYVGTSNRNAITPWKAYLKEKEPNRDEALCKLQSNYDLPLYVRLLMEGTRNSAAGNPDIGIILFDRSFELLFDTLVEIHMRKSGIFDKNWERYIEGDLVSRGNRLSKLKEYSRILSQSGRDFAQGEAAYDYWFENCRQVRNAIAHGKLKDPSVDVAFKARAAVWNAFEFFGVFHGSDILIADQYFKSGNNRYEVRL